MRSNVFNMSPKQAKNARTVAGILLTFLCVIVAFIVLLPILVLIINVTRSGSDIVKGFSFVFGAEFGNNFKKLLNYMSDNDYSLIKSFMNSVIISVLSTGVSIYFSAMTAYAVHVYNFKGKAFFEKFLLILIIIPSQLGAVGFFLMARTFLSLSPYIAQTYLSYAIFVLPAVSSASTVYYIRQYMKNNFSMEYVDAARMDGASEFQIFNTICLPFIKSSLATMALFGIIASWNNFMGPLTFIRYKDLYTLPQIAYYIGKETVIDYGVQYMGIFITALPMLLVYIVMNRIIMKGTAAGGIK